MARLSGGQNTEGALGTRPASKPTAQSQEGAGGILGHYEANSLLGRQVGVEMVKGSTVNGWSG